MSERSVFLAALDLADVAQRHDYLAEACGEDNSLRGHVEELLEAHEQPGKFMRQPAAALMPTVEEPPGAEAPGTVIGPYKLLERIGSGGFGDVYMAEQTQPVRRKVALKILKPGLDSREIVARFEAERQALAIMDHPNIAKVLDGGTTPSGRPFFAMELVRGVPITEYCDRHQLTPRQRLELFVPVCQAVQHAHQKGIIHRDLKPSNVLVSLLDTIAVPKVIDFGVAKALGQQLTDKTLHTGFAQMIGTPLYMSPEQAGMSGLDTDTRSDIYALGVLLYELLTGTTPFTKERFKQAAYDEIRRIIREEEPPKPSTRLSESKDRSSISAQRHMEPAGLTKVVRGELDWIVMKCLEKDRSRRYETATGLAADVQRYLHDEPVQACPPSAWYRFRKFARRNKPQLAGAGLVLFFLVLLGAGAWSHVQDRAQRRADTAQQNAVNEERVRTRLAQARQIRAELHQMLDDRTGLNRLLNDPAFWQARIDVALGEWKEAKLLQAAGPIDPALQVQIEELAGQLHQEQRHRETALALEKAREEHSIVKTQDGLGGTFHYSGALQKYRHAFAQAGLDVDHAAPDVLAQAIGRSPLRRQLLAALDDFAYVVWREEDDDRRYERLLTTGRLADPDPLRDRLRDPKLWGDGAAAAILAQEFLDNRRSMAELSAPSLLLHGLMTSGSLRERWFRQAHRLHPDDFWLAFWLGNALSTEKPAEAAGYFSAALALRPRNAKAWHALGRALHASKDLPGAIDAYQQAVANHKQDALAWTNLGVALHASNDLPGAIDAHRKALAINKQFYLAWTNLGAVLSASKDLPGAIDAYQKAVAIDKQYAPAWHGLALALVDRKDLPAAIDACARVVELQPDNAEIWCVYAGVLLWVEDAARYRQVCALTAKRFGLTQDARIAYLTARIGTLTAGSASDDATSLCLAEQAVKAEPKAGWYLHTLGLAHYRAGQFDEAARWLRESMEQDPEWPAQVLNWLALAMTHHRLGQPKEAQQWLTKAVNAIDEAAQQRPEGELGGFPLHVHDWLACHLLRREAEALIQVPGSRD